MMSPFLWVRRAATAAFGKSGGSLLGLDPGPHGPRRVLHTASGNGKEMKKTDYIKPFELESLRWKVFLYR